MKRVLPILLLLATAAFAQDKPDLEPPANAERAENGLATLRLTEGNGGEHPANDDIVKVRYSVWKEDGTLIDSTKPPRIAMLPLTKMIPGWRMAAEKMTAGEKLRAWVPESLGGKIKGTLIIDTELVEILHAPVTPPDVAAPPDDAIRTKSGLAYKVLRAGTGTVHPRRRSRVRVHYTGWTTNGQMFDSSILTGEPSEFSLDGVIPGWTEGIQLMVEGEQTRFWIPAKLAYGNDKTKPQGMLVFDVELVGIK